MFLDWKYDGYMPKKSGVVTKEGVHVFFQDAPEATHLLKKLVTVIGIARASR